MPDEVRLTEAALPRRALRGFSRPLTPAAPGLAALSVQLESFRRHRPCRGAVNKRVNCLVEAGRSQAKLLRATHELLVFVRSLAKDC